MTRLSRSLVLGSGAIFQAIGLREKLQENHIFIHTSWENLWFPVKIFPYLSSHWRLESKTGFSISHRIQPQPYLNWTLSIFRGPILYSCAQNRSWKRNSTGGFTRSVESLSRAPAAVSAYVVPCELTPEPTVFCSWHHSRRFRPQKLGIIGIYGIFFEHDMGIGEQSDTLGPSWLLYISRDLNIMKLLWYSTVNSRGS